MIDENFEGNVLALRDICITLNVDLGDLGPLSPNYRDRLIDLLNENFQEE